MSSNASGSRPPIDLRDFIDDKRDNPPPYCQEPIYEGFYVEDDTQLILEARKCRRNPADCSDGIERGFVNPGFQNQPHNPQYPQHPPNPHHLGLQDGQQSSQSTDPHQAQYGAYGSPSNYTANQVDVNGKLRYDAYYPPQEMQATGQQQAYPSPSFHDPRSVAATYPPYATTGQYVVTLQPQDPAGGQPHAIIAQPIMENPPDDYMAYSIFAACCCSLLVGLMAVARSKECRTAILDGDRELAEKKSRSALNTANAAVGIGILALIVAGVVIGLRVSSLIK